MTTTKTKAEGKAGAPGDTIGEMIAKPESAPSEIDGEPTNDPFDPSNLRLPSDFGEVIGVKKELVTVPVRRPDRQWFVRVHPDPSYSLNAAVIDVQEDRTETYLVPPALCADIPGEVIAKALFTAINRQGVLFIWPARMPRPDGRQDNWNRSAFEAMQIARGRWVRTAANMSLGAYEIFTASADLPEPEWPDIEFKKILEVAFRDRFIQSHDHPVLRRLRGEL